MKEKVVEHEKILPEAQAINQALLDALPDLMFILNKDAVYLDYKAGGNGDLYEAPNDFLGKRVDEVMPPELARLSILYIKRALKSRHVEIFDYKLEIEGELHDYECHMNAIDDSSVIAIVRDITERQLGAEKFRNLFESAPDPLLLIKPDGCIGLVNNQTVKQFGYPRKELIGKNLEILIPERFRRGHFQHIREYFLKPTVRPMGRNLELFALRKDGIEFPVDISLSPIEAQAGTMAVAAIRDITFRKQAEEELTKHREHLEELVAERTKELQNEISEHKRTGKELRTTREYLDTVILNMPAGLAILEGPEFRYFRINHELADINGVPVEEHLGRPLTEVLPQAAKDIVPMLQKVLNTGESTTRREFSTRLPKDPDEIRHFLDAFFPIKGQDGEVKAVGTVVLDITQRKQSEEALRQAKDELETRVKERTEELQKALQESEQAQETLLSAENRLEQLMMSSSTMIYSCEASGNFPATYVSKNVSAVLGYSVKEFLSNPSFWEEGIHPKDRPLVFAELPRIFENDRHVHEYRFLHKDGDYRWIHDDGQLIRDESGNPSQIVGSCHDITDRKLAEAKLHKSYDEIERLKEQLQAEAIYLREEIRSEHGFHEIIGNSDALLYVLNRVESIAPTDTSVLILGETGTGKELFARAIHDKSRRKDSAFVKINCATLPNGLIESELFGHEKGAFTGAVALRRGRFELAKGGTIFLDEIGELPLELQPKLLRVLQEGEFERLGSEKTQKIDVRVIAATNRDLSLEVSEGRFRKDLFYRLDVFPITVPPLRDRLDDLIVLTEHFIIKFSKKLGKHVDKISHVALAALKKYHWPGNVRELENIIERAMVACLGSELKLVDDLRPPMEQQVVSYTEQTLAEVERKHITQTLEKVNWRIEGDAGAAKILGMHPSTLRNRLLKLNIRRSKTAN